MDGKGRGSNVNVHLTLSASTFEFSLDVYFITTTVVGRRSSLGVSTLTMSVEGGKLGKLKTKLSRLSEKIDAADQRSVDAKQSIKEAIARLEKAEKEVTCDLLSL